MEHLFAIFLVSIGVGQGLAAELDVPTCDLKIVRECNGEFGITLSKILELSSQSTRCVDAFEEDEDYRCNHECILKRLIEFYGLENLLQLFRDVLYCDVDPKRIEYLFEHCTQMVADDGNIAGLKCGESYAIHRCIRMHLNIYPPGSHPPSFCSIRPPTKENCTKEALTIDPGFCTRIASGWNDNFTSPADMCYEVCLLRGMGYIVGDVVQTEVWYQAAFPFIPLQNFETVLGNCVKELRGLGMNPKIDNCQYFYNLFKCVQYYLDPNNDSFLIES